MSITDTYQASISGSDGARVTGSFTETGATQITLNTNFAASTTNQLVAIAWTVANTQAIYILSSQDMTIKTNSSGSPANTISLKAGIPLLWNTSAGYYSNLFTTNVTAWYITCTNAAQLQAVILTS